VGVIKSEFITSDNDNDGTVFDMNSCGVSASCMANIPQCKPGDENCAVVSWSSNNADLDVTLTYSGSKTWVAFGIAPVGRNPAGMDLADIYYCQDRTTGLGVESAWAATNTRPKTEAVYAGAIVDGSVRTIRSSSGDTSIYSCSFTKKGSFVKEDIEYTLNANTTWNVMIAKGGMTGDKPDYHGYSQEANVGNVLQHNEAVAIHPDMDHVVIGVEPGKAPISLVKVHAIMMYLAWGVLAPIGISASALLKITQRGGPVGKQWFQLHRAILSTVMLLTITAFILIFVEKKAWVTFDKSVPHAVMGCIVTAFCLINPIMGILRPGLDSPNRMIFNIAHHLVGYGAQVLAYATIYIGMIDLFGLEEWTWYVLAAAIAIWAVSILALKVIEKTNNDNAVNSETSNVEENVSMPNHVLTVLFYAAYFALSFSVLIELSL